MTREELIHGGIYKIGRDVARFDVIHGFYYLNGRKLGYLTSFQRSNEIACRIGTKREDIGFNWRKEHIKGVPLTPEILEKNGWEKKGSPYEWKNNIWVQRWNLPINTGSFQILDCPNYDGFTWNNIELNFVHTLQHALRLCGLEELADNFKV